MLRRRKENERIWLQSTIRSTTVNPTVFLPQNAEEMCRCRLQQQRKCRRYFPPQKLNCHFTVTIGPKPRKGERNGWILFCWSRTIPVFSAVLWAFQKGRLRSFSRFGRWEKSTHFKEMAKDYCLSFTTVNKLVLRGSERTIEFQATDKRGHKSENRGEESHPVLLSTSQLYSPQVPDKCGLEPNIFWLKQHIKNRGIVQIEKNLRQLSSRSINIYSSYKYIWGLGAL